MLFSRLSKHGWRKNSVTQRKEQETLSYTPSSIGVGRTLCSTSPPGRPTCDCSLISLYSKSLVKVSAKGIFVKHSTEISENDCTTPSFMLQWFSTAILVFEKFSFIRINKSATFPDNKSHLVSN